MRRWSAAARFNVQQGWSVAPIFTSGSPGIDDFNVIAAACNTFQASCPAGRVAIEIDGFVESAPSVNAAYFERDQITISGSFTEEEAKDPRPGTQLRCPAARTHPAGEPHRQFHPR